MLSFVLFSFLTVARAGDADTNSSKEDTPLKYRRLDANIGGLVMYSNGQKNVLPAESIPIWKVVWVLFPNEASQHHSSFTLAWMSMFWRLKSLTPAM